MQATEHSPPQSTSRGHALLVVVLLGLVTAFAAYQSDPAFAAQVDAAAAGARDQMQHALNAFRS